VFLVGKGLSLLLALDTPTTITTTTNRAKAKTGPSQSTPRQPAAAEHARVRSEDNFSHREKGGPAPAGAGGMRGYRAAGEPQTS